MSEVASIDLDLAQSKVEIDVERHLLGTTIRLSDGTEGLIYSRGSKNDSNKFTYSCHLCGVANLPGERCLQTHIAGRKHQQKLNQGVVDAVTFRAPLAQKPKIQMNIAPGEPVPPGFENEVKAMAEIQPSLDKYKETALSGLEYVIELNTAGDKEPGYICLLCDKRGDPRTIIVHLTSFNHRLKYLEKHFPSVVKELSPFRYNSSARTVVPTVVQTVCEAIEDHFGRLTPTVYETSEFNRNRAKIHQEIANDKHFDEKNGPSFVTCIDKKEIQESIKKIEVAQMPVKKRDPSPPKVQAPKKSKADNLVARKTRRDSLDSISSSSSLGRTPTRPKRGRRSRSRSRSRSRARRVRSPPKQRSLRKRRSQSPAYKIVRPRMSRSPPFGQKPSTSNVPAASKTDRPVHLPTPSELSRQASEIAQERYKWEKYRCLLEIAIKDFEKSLKEHEKNPEKHPLYPEEWKKFWNKRYKELQADKKDPNKHDFKPEWIIFWTKRMKELHLDAIDKKKIELRKKLSLPDNGEEKTDQLKQQYTIKTAGKQTAPAVIDISDESDNSLDSAPSKSKRAHREKRRSPRISPRRSPKRSTSPISDDEDDRFERRLRPRASRDRDYDRERYPSDFYRPAPPPAWGASTYYAPPGSHPPSRYGGYRTLDHYNYPRYEPEPMEEEEEKDDEPLTVVSVLRLLTALEEHLGSLGPKVNDLLAKALALEKVKANSADDMLLNDDNCVLFETIKEKLKGQLLANVLDVNKIKAAKRAIKNIAAVIHQVNNTAKKKPDAKTGDAKNDDGKKKEKLSIVTPVSTKRQEPWDRQALSSKLAAALVANEKTDVSTDQMEKLINVFFLMVKLTKTQDSTANVDEMLIDMGVTQPPPPVPTPVSNPILITPVAVESLMEKPPKERSLTPDFDMFAELQQDEPISQNAASSSLEGLTDSDLQTLLQNFKHLSNEEQMHLIDHLKKLESTDPKRVEKLRKFVDLSDLKNDDGILMKKVAPAQKVSAGRDKEDEYNKRYTEMADSDDDDDYSFDDVVKAASNKMRDPGRNSRMDNNSQPARDSVSRDMEEVSNMSKASNSSNLNSNLSLADTQSLIANLMGSLQKNSTELSNPTVGSSIPTLDRHRIVGAPTEPFYAGQQTVPTNTNSMLNQFPNLFGGGNQIPFFQNNGNGTAPLQNNGFNPSNQFQSNFGLNMNQQQQQQFSNLTPQQRQLLMNQNLGNINSGSYF